jgi:hypothetical protein
MELTVYIRPAISPLDRGDVEDLLVEALGEGVDVSGGGMMLDGSECDLEIALPDEDDRDPVQVLQVARDVLARIRFSLPTEVQIVIDGVCHPLHLPD